jgi:hypothetical protein
MFIDDEDEEPLQQCPDCHANRYLDDNHQRPAASVNKTSIRSVIASKIGNPLTRKQLRYRHERPTNHDNGTKSDIFDGTFYKTLVRRGLFNNPDDVAIGLSLDGFNPFKASSFKCTIVNMVIYNIHPKDR